MTFGKCVWDGCTRHAEKESTNACRAHHVVIRNARCSGCQRHLTSSQEVREGRCRRCATARAA
jgi:hypothetical protein